MKILANDGISNSGVKKLEESGLEVITTNVAQEQLENYINENEISGILVRSATTVRKEQMQGVAHRCHHCLDRNDYDVYRR